MQSKTDLVQRSEKKNLAFGVCLWEIPNMKTLTVDDKQRVRLPDAKPSQVFSYVNNGDGTITLTLVKAEAQEPFPPGSLKKYATAERDKEMLQILQGCTQEVRE